MMIPSSDKPDRNIGGHVWIPVDDTHCWAYTMTWNATRPLTQEEKDKNLEGFGIHCEVDQNATRWDLNISNVSKNCWIFFGFTRENQNKKWWRY